MSERDSVSRAQHIVDMILAGDRYVNSQTFSDRVYRDEPILRTGASAYGRHKEASPKPAADRRPARPEASSSPEPLWVVEPPRPVEPSVHRMAREFQESPRYPQPPRQRHVDLPAPYRQARRLAQGRNRRGWGYAYTADNAKLFVEQARVLADLEDDYASGMEGLIGYRGFCPTYEDLSDHELRCYISWRTQFRAGAAREAPVAFWRLYAFEVICGVGIEPGQAGYEALANLAADDPYAEAVREQSSRWAHDYAIYYGLDPSLVNGGATSNVAAVALLRRAEVALLSGGQPVAWPDRARADLPTPEELLDALVLMSRYRADRSRFFRDRREDVAWVACRVFADMVSHCNKRRKTGLVEGFFGPPTRTSYTVFPSAMFWTDKLHADVTYEVSPSESYVCDHGFWWRTLPCRRAERNRELGTLLHAIDARMRRALGDKHALKDKSLPKYQAKIVDARIAELVALREAEEAARITIDRSALGSIRTAAARTREALLTDEERDDSPLVPEPKAYVPLVDTPQTAHAQSGNQSGDIPQTHAPAPSSSDLPLSDQQLALLRALVDGDSVDGFDAMFVSLAADAINEAFLDIVGDTVVDFDGDAPVLVEDYVDEVRAVL